MNYFKKLKILKGILSTGVSYSSFNLNLLKISLRKVSQDMSENSIAKTFVPTPSPSSRILKYVIDGIKELEEQQCTNYYLYAKSNENGIIQFDESSQIESKDEPKIQISSTNYLSLLNHPRLLKAGEEAARKYGAGVIGTPILNGNSVIHKQLSVSVIKRFASNPNSIE